MREASSAVKILFLVFCSLGLTSCLDYGIIDTKVFKVVQKTCAPHGGAHQLYVYADKIDVHHIYQYGFKCRNGQEFWVKKEKRKEVYNVLEP